MEITEVGTGIGTAVLPWVREKDDAYKNMEQILKDAGTEILYMGAGDRLASETMKVTCLWPEKGLHGRIGMSCLWSLWRNTEIFRCCLQEILVRVQRRHW